MKGRTCPGCGARVADDSERCDLCGTPLADVGTEPVGAPDDIPEPSAAQVGEEAEGVFCNECGWKNPLGARFCSRCGTRLQDLTEGGAESGSAYARRSTTGASSATQTDAFHEGGSGGAKAVPGVRKARGPASSRDQNLGPDASGRSSSASATSGTGAAGHHAESGSGGLSRYVAAVVGLGVLVVVALYLITVMSKQRVSSPMRAAVEAPARVRSAAVIEEYESVPVPEQHESRLDSLRAAITSASGIEKRRLQDSLVSFFLDIGRIDRAAIEQQRIAQETGDVADWRAAGDLLFDWMETVTPERRTDVALLTIDAYERVLESDPDNLDVRADLGWAYQYDPQNPMRAIQHTNRVLEADPSHLAANYNRAVFLLRINRIEDAMDQLEKVKELAGAESPYYRQADVLIESVRRDQAAR